MRRYSKAIVSLVYFTIASLALTAEDGLTLQETLAAVAAGLAGSGLVYGVPNRPPRNKPRDPEVSEQAV